MGRGRPARRHAMTAPAKTRRPETPAQAAHFQRLLSSGLEMGLCHTCAVALAYGRQHGFKQVRPPCAACRPLAATHAPRWAYAHEPSEGAAR